MLGFRADGSCAIDSPLLVPDFNIVFHRRANRAVVASSQVYKQPASKCESWFSDDERQTGGGGTRNATETITRSYYIFLFPLSTSVYVSCRPSAKTPLQPEWNTATLVPLLLVECSLSDIYGGDGPRHASGTYSFCRNSVYP